MTPNPVIRALIVDDEKEACANLQNMLHEYVDADIDIVGIAHNTADAEKLVGKVMPDAVFLDIEMPNENAFLFLDRISPFPFEVIFVTAYDDYAVRAFKLNAIDYILKPISIPELKDAVRKLSDRLKYKSLAAKEGMGFSDISAQLRDRSRISKITLKDNNSVEVVDLNDIFFIEAQGSYSRVVFLKEQKTKEVVMSTALSYYEDILPVDLFYRTHKSYLVNCRHIRKIIKDIAPQIAVGRDFTLPVSRRRFPLLLDFLKNNDLQHE